MNYVSTRGGGAVSSAQAIVAGLAPDGGLYLPETLPQYTLGEIKTFCRSGYTARATGVLERFLTDFTREELHGFVNEAYAPGRFAPSVAPVAAPADGLRVLELFRGPTCAFKDFALQLLPRLLTAALRKTGESREAVILVATSGDTGKAALEGFADVAGTRICVFYPDGGTSNIQRLQMTTQAGGNVQVLATQGNFDDAQNGVKRIFTDSDFAAALADKGFLLSSANSINWGRLAPQIAYYFSAYCDLCNAGDILPGELVNFVVPTGNFGNILAAYFAKHCGLPIGRLICASNRNNVLTDFIRTGTYDRARKFFVTSSPSMDILVSSNLERLLYLLGGRDADKVRGLMDALRDEGRYTIDADMQAALQAEFSAGCADDTETAATIQDIFRKTGYLCDPHTAVAAKVYADYRRETGDLTPTVIVSTASPFKFAGSVLPAIGLDAAGDDFAQLDALACACGQPVPDALFDLREKNERFGETVAPTDMRAAVAAWLNV